MAVVRTFQKWKTGVAQRQKGAEERVASARTKAALRSIRAGLVNGERSLNPKWRSIEGASGNARNVERVTKITRSNGISREQRIEIIIKKNNRMFRNHVWKLWKATFYWNESFCSQMSPFRSHHKWISKKAIRRNDFIPRQTTFVLTSSGSTDINITRAWKEKPMECESATLVQANGIL